MIEYKPFYGSSYAVSYIIVPKREHFKSGYYTINGIKYTEFSIKFIDAFNKARIWERLTND